MGAPSLSVGGAPFSSPGARFGAPSYAWLGVAGRSYSYRSYRASLPMSSGELAASWRATRGSWWRLASLYLTLGLINLAGFLALGVSCLVTYPLTTVATAHAYRAPACRAVSQLSVPTTAPPQPIVPT